MAAQSSEARSSTAYGDRVTLVLLLLSPAYGDVVARSEAASGIYLPNRYLEDCSRDEQHALGRTHISVGMRPHVELNSHYKVPYIPIPVITGKPDTTGRARDRVVDKCRLGKT